MKNWISLYEKLIAFAKENIWVIMSFWIPTAFIVFAPTVILQHLNLLDLPKGVDIAVGLFFILSSSLLVIRGLRALHEKLCIRKKTKQREALLLKLEGILKDRCLTPGVCFNKDKCVAWANNVEILLKGTSTQYNEWVVHRTTMLQTHDMFDGMGYLVSQMRNILDLAIKEMKEEIKNKKIT